MVRLGEGEGDGDGGGSKKRWRHPKVGVVKIARIMNECLDEVPREPEKLVTDNNDSW